MHTTTTASLVLLALALTGCDSDPLAPAMDAAVGNAAPVVRAIGSTPIPGRWIVMLRAGARPTNEVVRDMMAASGVRAERTFGSGVRGFSATLSDAEVERVRRDPNVAYVEQDALVRIAAASPSDTWNLHRIGLLRFLEMMGHASATGAGVTAYVIDTGLRIAHEDFGERASHGFDAVDGGAADDCNGHGTHVAGTLGGQTYGVAPGVALVAVRVLDCGGVGTLSDVIAGIDWVAQHHRAPAVANLSLVGAASRAVDDAVARAIEAGVVFVVAAGNDARDACGYSPARTGGAITVGATTADDAVWSLSNQGSCVDLFAPGEAIRSAWHTSDDASGVLSGTSMAAPHAAGAAALQLELRPDAPPADIERLLIDTASRRGLDRLAPNSPDLLLQVRPLVDWRYLTSQAS